VPDGQESRPATFAVSFTECLAAATPSTAKTDRASPAPPGCARSRECPITAYATGRVSRPRTTPGGRQESPHEPPSRATRPVILDVWARASARGRFGSATPESARAAERSCRRGRRLAGTVRLAPSPAFPAWVARLRRRQDLHRRRRTVSQRTADLGRAPSFQLRMPADPLKPRTTAVMGSGWSGWTRGRGGSRVLPSSCLTSRSRRRLGPAGPKASAVSPPI
jgi:hypothetical protein